MKKLKHKHTDQLGPNETLEDHLDHGRSITISEGRLLKNLIDYMQADYLNSLESRVDLNEDEIKATFVLAIKPINEDSKKIVELIFKSYMMADETIIKE